MLAVGPAAAASLLQLTAGKQPAELGGPDRARVAALLVPALASGYLTGDRGDRGVSGARAAFSAIATAFGPGGIKIVTQKVGIKDAALTVTQKMGIKDAALTVRPDGLRSSCEDCTAAPPTHYLPNVREGKPTLRWCSSCAAAHLTAKEMSV